jgi:hypothetical protein
VFVDVIGIVRTAVPVECCFSFFPLLSGDFIEKVVIAWDAAAIFRWAPSFTTKKLRMRCLLLRRFDVLYNNPMLPIVAKVVNVAELLQTAR